MKMNKKQYKNWLKFKICDLTDDILEFERCGIYNDTFDGMLALREHYETELLKLGE